MKVVINNCYGGFGLSRKAVDWLYDNYRLYLSEGSDSLPRHDSRLVKCIETLGEDASDEYSNLVIRDVDGNKYRICEYDGAEWIETPDSIDWIEVVNPY